ncbi:recombinase family protein [Chroococcidiopsis sp. CCMEE 29]|uniref:recombinase family protein n=1 Tax=Chroococcidiopsis sp. CCMEE 29 TaxID=155894 RepID=UPI0020200756|nr:recombinase family protein [Chroococcidiopsis sp. CCMEE 29]
MTRVIELGRASTSDQKLSREVQETRIRHWCLANDLELIGFLYDGGISGKTLDRPAVKTALQLLEAGEADGIIVFKLDRLTRNLSELNQLIENYFKDKYALISVSEVLDTTTASGRLVINILGSVAQWERETISERTKLALAVKKERGEPVGRRPTITFEMVQQVKAMRMEDFTHAEIAEIVGISCSSVGQILRRK